MKAVCFILAFLLSNFTMAVDIGPALLKLNQVRSDATQLLQTQQAGQERAMLCGYCHGKDGNSVKEDIPNLASQNPEYLLQQFALFANGERKSYVMQSLSKALSDEERINLSLYFTSLAVTPLAGEGSAQGAERYQSFCFACHGEAGLGNKDLPRLAGQKKAFLIKTLTAFKEGKLARVHSPMVKIMRAVQASDIEPLADYISHLK